ncbi:uncharacterized protein LOC133784951 [Humulus lupulus]|uniref:uncharacterized protein LOC133784951 n=1 Tax=Humulus lupulus TaxID=3486 RepID=UPI002B40DD7F|nr:uncharacterized protein LOC133784951 [Humulus lupulus]
MSGAGPVVKRLKVTRKTTPKAGDTTKSLSKGKDTSSAREPAPVTTVVVGQVLLPPPRHMPAPLQVIQTETPIVQIPVESQDLEKIPEAFWGIVHETSTHMVGHAYKANARVLRAIEERSLEDVLESSMGMNLTSVLDQYRSIACVKARNKENRAELATAKESEQAAKAALTVAQKIEHAAKAALISSQESEHASKTALSASQAQAVEANHRAEQLQVENGELKAKLLKAKVKAKEEAAVSSSTMEEMLYH